MAWCAKLQFIATVFGVIFPMALACDEWRWYYVTVSKYKFTRYKTTHLVHHLQLNNSKPGNVSAKQPYLTTQRLNTF